MGKAETVIMFDLVFSILLLTFGAGTGTISLTPLSSLPPPPLAPQPGNIRCGEFDYTCQATQGIATATAYIGWAIVNIPVIVGYLIIETVIFANIILSLTFSASFSSNGVPYLGFIFIGLQVFVLWEVIRTFRGSSTGV